MGHASGKHGVFPARAHVLKRYDLTRWFTFEANKSYRLTLSRSFNELEDEAWGLLEINNVSFHVGKVNHPWYDPGGT